MTIIHVVYLISSIAILLGITKINKELTDHQIVTVYIISVIPVVNTVFILLVFGVVFLLLSYRYFTGENLMK